MPTMPGASLAPLAPYTSFHNILPAPWQCGNKQTFQNPHLHHPLGNQRANQSRGRRLRSRKRSRRVTAGDRSYKDSLRPPPREMSKSKGPSRAGSYGANICRTSAMAPGGVKQYPPILAKIKGPGAGKYGRQPCTGIRNHDFTMFAEPAYTMRIKHTEKILADTISPGACFVDPHLSRFGWWKPSSFFIQNRKKSLSLMSTPAPTEYYAEKVHPQGEPYAPAYSLADRTRYRENDPNPAPNAYTLPVMLGPGLPIKPSAPCYSMASKMDTWSNAEKLARVPGPASFAVPEPNVYLHRQPAYSMWRKYKFIKDTTPGPADYKTPCVTTTKPRAPDFSLGIRHSEYLTPLVIDVME